MKYPANSLKLSSLAGDAPPPLHSLVSSIARRSLGVVSAAAMAGTCLLSGCSIVPSHVHNEGKAKIAAAAQARMQEYSKNAPAMYAAMSSNVDKFKVEIDYLLSELAKNESSALAVQLPTLTWEQVAALAIEGEKSIAAFHKKVGEEGQAFRERTRLAKARAATAQEQVAKARSEVKEARENIAAWNGYIALLQQGFKDLPDTTKKLDVATGVDALKMVGNKEIVFADADGKEVKKKVSKIVAEQAAKIGAQMTGKNEKGKSIFPKAPGISLLIMNHALDLATLELRKAEMELEQANERVIVFQDALAESRVAGQLYREVAEEAGQLPLKQKAFQSVALMWRAGNASIKTIAEPEGVTLPERKAAALSSSDDLLNHQNTVMSCALTLRKLAIAESVLRRNRSLFVVKVGRLEHQQSIARSALADATHRSLIQAQLNGLAAYHQGGFTKEDAANIVRIAQSIALFSIANNTQ